MVEGDLDRGSAGAVTDGELIEELEGARGLVEVLVELVVLKDGGEVR